MEIILTVLIVLGAFFYYKFIRLNSIILFSIAITTSAVSILFFSSNLNPITTGSLGFAFFIVVMFTGVIKKNTKIHHNLRSVRRELSILGFIFILPHAYTSLYDTIFNQLPLEITGLLTLIVITPLFITSFKLTRRSMPTSTWISIHRYSYLAYFLIYIHLLMSADLTHSIGYTILFGIYSILKLKTFINKKPTQIATIITIVIASVSLFLFSSLPEDLKQPYNVIEGNELKDGTYIGYAKGYRNIDTVVKVIIEENTIQLIIINECGCTPNSNEGIYYDAAYEIARDIKNKNSTLIDSTSGATDTSNGIIKAVRDALEHALTK